MRTRAKAEVRRQNVECRMTGTGRKRGAMRTRAKAEVRRQKAECRIANLVPERRANG